MKPGLTYLLLTAKLAVVFYVVLTAATLHIKKEPVALEFLRQCEEGPPDILLFGDSIMASAGHCDSGDDTVEELVEAHGIRVAPIIHAAFAPSMYDYYVPVIDMAPNRPDLIVMPVNLRSFSPTWHKRPAFQFEEKKAGLLAMRNRFGPTLWKHHMAARFLDKRLSDEWLNEAMFVNGEDIGNYQEVMERLKGRVPRDLECRDDEAAYEADLGVLYKAHYLSAISEEHPQVRGLRNVLQALAERNAEVVVYITPVNVERGERILGTGFAEEVASRAALIESVAREYPVRVENLVNALPDALFVDRGRVSEHLNYEGRQWLAGRIAGWRNVAVAAR